MSLHDIIELAADAGAPPEVQLAAYKYTHPARRDDPGGGTMSKPLHKATIVIWSETDPCDYGLAHLAQEAEIGWAYCSRFSSQHILYPESDPDWDGTDFFEEL